MKHALIAVGVTLVVASGCGTASRSSDAEGSTSGASPGPCAAGQHLEGAACVANVCAPGCRPNERCETHGGSTCTCISGPCEPPTACNNGVDDDGDGWVDALDPDCAAGSTEKGLGTTGCNDGKDNDGDGAADGADPQCTSGGDDEVLGSAACGDACMPGAEKDGKACTAWDSKAMVWRGAQVDDGAGQLHNRARVHDMWLRTRLMPEGGIMRGRFSNASFNQPVAYDGTRDSPIWTGIHIGTEALRYLTTKSTDALEQIERSVRVIDRWWRISGDRGYLARYAAPITAPPQTLAIFNSKADTNENHKNVPFEGATWHWKGNISRDQYQGVIYGLSLAYDATPDPTVKELIRSNVVSFVEQLMVKQRRDVNLVVNGSASPLPVQMEMEHVVFTDDEMTGGKPTVTVTTSPFEAGASGMLFFWPRPAQYLRTVPGLGWLPDITLHGQGIQLGAAFAVALQVTEGVPAYAARRAAIQAHYDVHFEEWAAMGAGWTNTNQCGGSYHGINIAYLPAYTWVRTEKDPTRKAKLRDGMLRDALWSSVADHKNVFFAYLYASQASPSDDVTGVVSTHTAQLAQFPGAPYTARPVDNRAAYPAHPSCEGLSSVAIDVADRVPASFIWERNPWELTDPGAPNFLHTGLDYTAAYWLGRQAGFLADDSPGVCLQWK